MLSETQTWFYARELIQRYGADADFEASLRAARHLINADFKAHEAWMQIARAVVYLKAGKTCATVH